MNGAFHISGIGLDAQQNALDTLANNIANLNTHGFKRAQVQFSELVSSAESSTPSTSSLSANSGLAGVMMMTNMALGTQGELERTDRSLDLAINGPGFIEVLGEDGQTLLWRGGPLRINPDGFMAAGNGMMLAAQINIPDDARDVIIASDGSVEIVDTSGEPETIGRIDMLRVRSEQGLVRQDGGFYRFDGSARIEHGEPGRDGMGEFVQGSLERSNVDLNREMIEMMIVQRAYSANAQIVQAADQLSSIANNLRR